MNFELLKETLDLLQKEVEDKRTTERNNSIGNLEEISKEFKKYHDELKEMSKICFMPSLRLFDSNKERFTVDIFEGKVILWIGGWITSDDYTVNYNINNDILLVRRYQKERELAKDLGKELIDKICNSLTLVMDNWDKVGEHFADAYTKKVNELAKELKGE